MERAQFCAGRRHKEWILEHDFVARWCRRNRGRTARGKADMVEIENTALAAPGYYAGMGSGCPLALASLRRLNGARSSYLATERSR
jgi:hypothetical protein